RDPAERCVIEAGPAAIGVPHGIGIERDTLSASAAGGTAPAGTAQAGTAQAGTSTCRQQRVTHAGRFPSAVCLDNHPATRKPSSLARDDTHAETRPGPAGRWFGSAPRWTASCR